MPLKKRVFWHTLFLEDEEQPSKRNYRTMFFSLNEDYRQKFKWVNFYHASFPAVGACFIFVVNFVVLEVLLFATAILTVVGISSLSFQEVPSRPFSGFFGLFELKYLL